MLIIRLVVKDKQNVILNVYEMRKFRKDGKRDHATIEFFLTKAEEALEKGERPNFEFLTEEVKL